jgi:hypothetical protein
MTERPYASVNFTADGLDIFVSGEVTTHAEASGLVELGKTMFATAVATRGQPLTQEKLLDALTEPAAAAPEPELTAPTGPHDPLPPPTPKRKYTRRAKPLSVVIEKPQATPAEVLAQVAAVATAATQKADAKVADGTFKDGADLQRFIIQVIQAKRATADEIRQKVLAPFGVSRSLDVNPDDLPAIKAALDLLLDAAPPPETPTLSVL